MPRKWNCVTACVVSYAAVLRVVTQRRLLRAWLRKCFNFLISSKPSLDAQNKASMLSEIFLNSRNETRLATVSIFVHLVTDHLFIYPFILCRLFYFISFHFILFIIFYRRSGFFYYFFFIYFVTVCPVPGCSGMFHVPGFVDAHSQLVRTTATLYPPDGF